MDEKLEHRVSRMSRNVTLAITLAAASAFVGCDYGDRGVSQPQGYQQAQATPTPGARAGGHYYYGGGGYHGGTGGYQPVPQGSGYTAPRAVAGDNTAGTRAPSTTAPGTGASVAPAAPKAPAVAPAKAPTGGFGVGGGSAAS